MNGAVVHYVMASKIHLKPFWLAIQLSTKWLDYSPFQKKNWSLQPQLVGLYERRPLHDPNMVFAYWSTKKTTMLGAKTIVLSWHWVLFPAAVV